MNHCITRRGILLGAASTVLPLGRLALAQDAAVLPAWFKFAPSLVDTWEFRAAPGDRNIVDIGTLGFEKRALTSVLVLYSRPSSAYDIAISKILDVLDDKHERLSFHVVNYGGNVAVAAAAIDEAERNGSRAILAMGSDPVADLWQIYRGGRLPVVTVCAKDPVILGQVASYEATSGNNFAFTSLNMPIDAQMDYLLQIRPKLQNIAILVDGANISAVETQAKPVVEYLNKRDVRALQLTVKDARNVRDELPELMRHALTAMQRNDPTLANSVFWITGSTSVFEQIALINQYAGKVPVLSVVPEVVKAGDDSAVLSVGVSFESNAHIAAVYLSDILEGKTKPQTMKIGFVSPPDVAINFRRAQAIGLRIPFSLFESASNIYDYNGRPVRTNGVLLGQK